MRISDLSSDVGSSDLASIKRLIEMEKQVEDGSIVRLNKKEQLTFTREIEKLRKSLGGIKEMPSLPDCLFIIDTGYEKNAVIEARKHGIPVVAVVDPQNGDTTCRERVGTYV